MGKSFFALCKELQKRYVDAYLAYCGSALICRNPGAEERINEELRPILRQFEEMVGARVIDYLIDREGCQLRFENDEVLIIDVVNREVFVEEENL